MILGGLDLENKNEALQNLYSAPFVTIGIGKTLN